MASTNLRGDLDCPICLQTYTDPVMLRCGHSFCRVCIDCSLDTQKRFRVYSCPECRHRFQERPELMKCLALCNIMEKLLFTSPKKKTDAGICCTYCVDSPVPAVKSCVHCEASLCDKHLRVHSKSPEHVLSEPSTSLEKRKCSVHKKILEYYCTEDSVCICVSCSLAGEHRGHQVEILDEASKNKKKKLRHFLQKLMTKRETTEERVQSLEEHREKAQEKPSGQTERVNALFTDIRIRLDDLEKRVLSEISRQEKEEKLLSFLIQQLEIKKDEQSKIRHIEELCYTTDPLTVLQDPDTGDLSDPDEGGGDEDTGGHYKQLHDIDDLDVTVISDTFHTLCDVISGIRSGLYIGRPADILLDLNTAANNIFISDDLKTAITIKHKISRSETAERFQDYRQVISSRKFSSGRHYWDVDISKSRHWIVGMCYPSIDRKGRRSRIGDTNKSWCLCRWYHNQYSARYAGRVIWLPDNIASERIRIHLDYEAGQLSFYEPCDPIRHLYTFTDTFSEPLHAAIWIGEGSVSIY